MMLTQEQLKGYQSDGFVVVESVLPEQEVIELRSCTEETIALGIEMVKHLSEEEKINFDDSELAAPPRAIAQGFLQDLAHRHERFWSLSRSSKILDLVEPIVGPDISMYLSRCVFKRRRDKNAVVAWHQDMAYWKGVPDKVIVAVALDRCTRESGGLCAIRATHLGPVLDHVMNDGFVRLAIPAEALRSLPDAKTVEVAAGDVLLFHAKLVHWSPGNISDNDRRILYFVYQPAVGAVSRRKGPPVIVRGKGSESWDRFPGQTNQ